MRWTRKYERIIKRFALFPIRIYGDYRWLEWVYIKQKNVPDDYFGIYTWCNRDFATRWEYETYKQDLRRRKMTIPWDKELERKYTRVIKRFALIPIKLNNKSHWLKQVYIKQRFVYSDVYSYWKDVDFATKEEHESYLRRIKNA